MNAQEYLDGAAARLRADGSEVSSAMLPGGQAMVGYQSKFKVQWMATKLHLFTFLVPVPHASAAALDGFTRDALEYTIAQKGDLRGLQVGVATIPVLVGDAVEPAAAEFARTRIIRKFGAFAWPAVVDLSSGTSVSHQGPVFVGGVYSRWLRKRTAAVLGTHSTTR